MKMYDSVTLICGQYSESPAAVRAVLELSDRPAFQRAAAFDAQSASGTSRFRYFAKDDLTS